MHSVLENDKDAVESGEVINDSINYGIGSFTPDLMFEQLVKDYKNAERLFGEKIIRFVSGYEPGYVERNIKIPEFQRELKKRIEQNIQKLKDLKLLDEEGIVVDKGYDLAAISLYIQELDNIVPKGISGERIHQKVSHYGGKGEIKDFKKGDRYRDIAIRRSVKTAIKRSHDILMDADLKVFERQSKGLVYIVYAMDISGSMKGNKLETAKKAGIALAFKAVENKDKVGLIVFGSEVKDTLMPTDDFVGLLHVMAMQRASGETNIISVIDEAITMFPSDEVTKHLILLTDAIQTVGTSEETLKSVSEAVSAGISISLIGISLDKKGEELAKKIVELGDGRLYIVKDTDNLDKIILEDYYEVM
ncbi:VWA domain-containing protein [Candidatus Woesearchaeota archaeon]|nr:VWA domain-containing protein [Candidatus Woesearchaeota archaeon]